MENIYNRVLQETGNGRELIVQTILHQAGDVSDFDRLIVGTGDHPYALHDAYGKTLDHGSPDFYTHNGAYVLMEPFYPRNRLIVLGGGHIALPLVEIANTVGFDVTVVDDRTAFANRQRFPAAKEVVCDRFNNYLGNLHMTPSDYVVIITRGHRYDQDCLRELAKQPFPHYVGMIGSKRRVQGAIQSLKDEGCSPEYLDRVNTPIGLNIGSVTPEEISISIVAEIIQKRRMARPGRTRVNRSDMDHDMLCRMAEIHEPCCVVTIVSSKGSVPRGPGAKMIVYQDGRIEGSIGGGCSESSIILQCMDIIGTGAYMLHDIDMTGSVAENEGMVCGGMMKVLIEDYVLTPSCEQEAGKLICNDYLMIHK